MAVYKPAKSNKFIIRICIGIFITALTNMHVFRFQARILFAFIRYSVYLGKLSLFKEKPLFPSTIGGGGWMRFLLFLKKVLGVGIVKLLKSRSRIFGNRKSGEIF